MKQSDSMVEERVPRDKERVRGRARNVEHREGMEKSV